MRELALLALLYATYSLTRLVADDALAPARERAAALLDVEHVYGLAWERPLNDVFVDVDLLGLIGSYQYATAHYVVTAVVLVWLYRRGPSAYVPGRRALLGATILALGLYLLLPMAPPRLVDGYVDVLALHAGNGWWGAEASAPQGLGGFTNQLAAFPSLHAGWALWVALVVQRHASRRVWRVLGWTHAVVTAVVIVGTGNHWVLDAVVGWLVVAAAWVGLDQLASPEPRFVCSPAKATRDRVESGDPPPSEELSCAHAPSLQHSPPSPCRSG